MERMEAVIETTNVSPREADSRRIAKLLESLPPHAIEAEVSLLGSILHDPDCLADVLQIVTSAEDFFKPTNGVIFKTAVRIYEEHSAVDIAMLTQACADSGTLDAVGGVNYLVHLAESVPTAAHAIHYSRLVKEKSVIRRLIETAGQILHDAYENPDQAQDVLANAEQRIFRIAQQMEMRQASDLRDLISTTMAQIEARDGKSMTGIGTGYGELDRMTGGLQDGEMIIIAARPSMGKTALALNISENVALQSKGVAVFSLEMGSSQLVQRLLASKGGIDGDRLRRNMLREEDFKSLMMACDALHDAPIYIDDTPGLNLVQLRAKARRLKQKHDIDLVVLDYLQLMTAGHRPENRQQEVSSISRGVKAMARELDVPVICLSQLNRAAEHREGHRPRMSDLRESGSIEQDADVIMLLHREEYYHPDQEWRDANPDKIGEARIEIAKQRNGPTGRFRLTWDSKTTRFHNYSPASPPMDMPAHEAAPSAGSGWSAPPTDMADDDLPI